MRDPRQAAFVLLTATVLCGALSRVVGSNAVNTVNALHVATAHGIRVDQIHLDSRGVFAEQLEIRATHRRRRDESRRCTARRVASADRANR
jgi:hypothetical protein